MAVVAFSMSVRPIRRLGAAAGLAFLLACSHQTGLRTAAAEPRQEKPAAAEEPAAPAAEERRRLELPQAEPPDGKWLVDEQGRKYFLGEVAKVEGWYHWLNPEKTLVRLAYGMTFEVASHDEDSIQLKIYKTPSLEELPPSPPKKPELPAAEKEKIAASYRNDTGAADRLAFEAFGRGLPARGQWRNGFKIADMNGDGHPDIVHGPPRKGGSVPMIFLGDGKGNWRRWAEVRFPSMAYDYGDVAVADFNGDGRLDLALAVHLRGFIALVADGPASFAEWGRGLDFRVPGQGGMDASGFSSRTLEAADWNGDGRPDLVSLGEGPRMVTTPAERPSTSFGFMVYLNQGDGSWVRQDELKQGARAFGEDLAVVDFTGDGKLDTVLGSGVMGAKELLRVGGNAEGWSKGELSGLRPSAYVGAVDAADFNGDGRIDVALGYLSREGGAWRTGVDVFLAGSGGDWERKAVAVEETRDWLTALDSGDLDGDGRLDLAAALGDGEVWIFLGKGDGSFLREEEPAEFTAAGGGCRGYDVQIVNLDADPAEELVAEFAGEPSAMFAPTHCVNQGSLTAWKARRKG